MALAFSPDGALLASASYDRSVRVWDVAQRRVLHVLSGHTDRVTTVAMVAVGAGSGGGGGAGEGGDAVVLVSGSYDKQIRLWNIRTGKAYRPDGLDPDAPYQR